MKKNNYIIILGVLLILNIFLLLNLTYVRSKSKQYIKTITSLKTSINTLIRFHLISQKAYIKNEHYKISKDFILEKENGDSVKLSELLTDEPKLIFRYSELNCNTCVDEEIQLIKKYLDKIKIERLIIVADYQNEENLFLFKRLNHIDIPVYNSRINKLELPAEKLNTPYAFVIDSSLDIRSLFIPNKSYPKFSEDYYSNIFSLINE